MPNTAPEDECEWVPYNEFDVDGVYPTCRLIEVDGEIVDKIEYFVWISISPGNNAYLHADGHLRETTCNDGQFTGLFDNYDDAVSVLDTFRSAKKSHPL